MSQAANKIKSTFSTQAFQTFAWCLLFINLFIVIYIWYDTSFGLLLTDYNGFWIAIGRLLGLVAAFSALVQFILMSRTWWIDRAFGMEDIAKFHSANGFVVMTTILLHPLALTIGYATDGDFFQQYMLFIQQYEKVNLALISTILFIAVVLTSMHIVRRKLPFERWYYVHLLVYGAIILAFGHQLAVGGSFAGEALYLYYWTALYIFVALNLIIWRFGMPVYTSIKYRFRVAKIVKETQDTWSVYITGRNLDKWKSSPGQYVLVRFLTKQMGAQEHPFSLSYIPKDNTLRLTIKQLGDYTRLIPELTLGTRVVVSGPFGAFTNRAAETSKRLYLAGGVGITPIRAMLEESVAAGNDNVLLYGSRTVNDIIFDTELLKLQKQGSLTVHNIISGQPGYKGEKGYVSIDKVTALVPDYKTRDIFICGSPVMTKQLIADLHAAGVDPARVHFERFTFHAD